jgi:GxxExxY protein
MNADRRLKTDETTSTDLKLSTAGTLPERENLKVAAPGRLAADKEPFSAKASFQGLHAGVTEKVLGVFFEVYNELGGGFLEGVYQQALRIALMQAGLRVDVECPVLVHFRGKVVGNFRADLIVDECVLLELKAVSAFDREHESQVLHYLRATSLEVGLLLNSNPWSAR